MRTQAGGGKVGPTDLFSLLQGPSSALTAHLQPRKSVRHTHRRVGIVTTVSPTVLHLHTVERKREMLSEIEM